MWRWTKRFLAWILGNLLWEGATSTVAIAWFKAFAAVVSAGVLAFFSPDRWEAWQIVLFGFLAALVGVWVANGLLWYKIHRRAVREPLSPEEWAVGRTRHDDEPARPDITAVCQVENDSVDGDTERWVARVAVSTNHEVGQVAVYIVGCDGFPPLTTAIPVGWTNEPGAVVRLGSAVPQWVFLGFVEHVRGHTGFFLLPAAPGFPTRHIHKPIRPPVGNILNTRLRVVRVEVGDYRDIDVRLGFPRLEGLPACDAHLVDD